MAYQYTIGHQVIAFADLKELLAKASPPRSGDQLAGLSATTYQERVAAQYCLADVPLKNFLNESVIPYEKDDITRLIMDSHDAIAFQPISHFTVGAFRDWLLSDEADTHNLQFIQKGRLNEN